MQISKELHDRVNEENPKITCISTVAKEVQSDVVADWREPPGTVMTLIINS